MIAAHPAAAMPNVSRETLLKRLESATEGSQELDAEIAEHLGWRHVEDAGGVSWWYAPGQSPNHSALPHYTTSLDAALPGENIVSVGSCYAPRSLVAGHPPWAAGHQDSETGKETAGAGHTEVLARRIAALKARS